MHLCHSIAPNIRHLPNPISITNIHKNSDNNFPPSIINNHNKSAASACHLPLNDTAQKIPIFCRKFLRINTSTEIMHNISQPQLAATIDHTILKPNATAARHRNAVRGSDEVFICFGVCTSFVMSLFGAFAAWFYREGMHCNWFSSVLLTTESKVFEAENALHLARPN